MRHSEPKSPAKRIGSMKISGLGIMVAALAAMSAGAAWSQASPVEKRTQDFLEAYVRGDKQVVLSLVDGDTVTMYGSDVAEVAHGAEALGKLMDADRKLWGGTAHVGAMQHVSVVEGRGIATIVFDVPFTVGGRPPVPVRVAAVWKREHGKWLVVQSSNAVVSEHQSAAELVGR